MRHSRRLIFQLSEVSVPRRLFEGVLDRIGGYRRAKLREGITTILPRGRAFQGVRLVFNALSPLAGDRRRQRWTSSMVHGKKRIPYWIDRRLTGLADPNIMPSSRLGCPLSLKTPNYGKCQIKEEIELCRWRWVPFLS